MFCFCYVLFYSEYLQLSFFKLKNKRFKIKQVIAFKVIIKITKQTSFDTNKQKSSSDDDLLSSLLTTTTTTTTTTTLIFQTSFGYEGLDDVNVEWKTID